MNWKTAYLETRVLSASPVELIQILYEHAILSVQEARTCLAERDIPGRSKAMAKAISILGELERSLDHQSGGDIAANLARLYRYMRERLTLGNLQQLDAPFAEVEVLLSTLGEAWQKIGEVRTAPGKNAFSAQMPPEPVVLPVFGSTTQYSTQSWSA